MHGINYSFTCAQTSDYIDDNGNVRVNSLSASLPAPGSGSFAGAFTGGSDGYAGFDAVGSSDTSVASRTGSFDWYNDFEFNGSITSAVFIDEQNMGTPGDLVAAFIDGEQRGVAIATEIPFGPFIDTYQFFMMLYSNQTSGERFVEKCG